MGLGYEGWVQVVGEYALGTGVSVPRARPRLESSAGYGGELNIENGKAGIGLPYNYDYAINDGSVSFELDYSFLSEVILSWMADRQASATIRFSSRYSNVQHHDLSFWTNISINSPSDSVVDGQISFVSLNRDSYDYGEVDLDTEIADSKMGNSPSGTGTALCPVGDFPSQLNPKLYKNKAPIPGWATQILVGTTAVDFITWSLSFSQEVVKFFTCESSLLPIAPKYLAVGPMSVVFSGSYISSELLLDSIPELTILIGPPDEEPIEITLERLEKNTEQDDLQTGESLTTVDVEYSVYNVDLPA